MGSKVQFVMDADTAKVVQNFDKLQGKLKAMELKFGDLKRKSRETGDAQARMGDQGGGALDKMKTGFVNLIGPIATVSGAIGLATKALQEMNAERERGASMAREMFQPFQRLTQISGGSASELQSLMGLTRDISAGQGVPPQEAASAVFSGRSLGFGEGEIREMAPIARVANLGAAIQGLGKFREAFGAKETGSARALYNKVIAAAAQSDIDVDTMMTASLSPAAAFARIGASDEELLATMSVLSGPGGATPDVVSTQIRSLATAFAKAPDQFGGLGFFGAFEKARAMGPEQRQKLVLGRVEAASAYTLMDRLYPKIQERAGQIGAAEAGTGGPGDLLSGLLGAAEGVPMMSAILRSRRALAGESLAEMGAFGPGRLGTESAISEMRERSIQRGESGFMRAGRAGMGRAAQFFGGDEEEVQRATDYGPFGLYPYLMSLGQTKKLAEDSGGIASSAKDLGFAASLFRESAEIIRDAFKPGPNKHTE